MTAIASRAERRAVVVHRNEAGLRVSCDLVPCEPLRADAVRVRPDYVGICGSDLEQIFGGMDDSFDVRFPHVLGHEWSGVVVEAGASTSRYAVGDRIVGHGSLGGNTWFGVSTDGAMADTFTVPEAMCFAVPDLVSPMMAALVEPLACCLQGLRVSGGADAGHISVVFGCGAIGVSMVGLLHSLGIEVVAVDRSERRLRVAKRLGADHIIVAGTETAGRVHAALGRGADLVVEASGAPAAQADAVEVTGNGARVLFMGLGHCAATRVSLHQIQNRNLHMMSSTGAPPEIWEPTLRLLVRTGLDLTPVVSDVFAFDDCVAALAAARDSDNHGKVVLSPNGEQAS